MAKNNIHTGSVIDKKNGYKIINCDNCGFNHIFPLPTEEELDTIYRNEYYTKEKPLYFERTKEDAEWWNLIYKDRFDTFEELLSDCKRKKILDIGSGPGFFLKYGKERGWDTLGVEPSEQAAEFSKNMGLNIVKDFLNEKTANSLGKFNVIHMNNVLEHILDPIGLIKIVSKLLNDKGILCIGVPNDYNPFQDVARKTEGLDPWWLAPPHHINYFNFNSLELLLHNNGFSLELKECSFPIDMFLVMGDNYIGDDEKGRKCHNKRKKLELNMNKAGYNKLRRKMLQNFAGMGIGREAVVYGRLK